MTGLLKEQAIQQLTSFVRGVGWVQKPQTKDGISEVRVRYNGMPAEPFTHVIKWLNSNDIHYIISSCKKKNRQRKARPRPRLLPRVNGGSHASHQ